MNTDSWELTWRGDAWRHDYDPKPAPPVAVSKRRGIGGKPQPRKASHRLNQMIWLLQTEALTIRDIAKRLHLEHKTTATALQHLRRKGKIALIGWAPACTGGRPAAIYRAK